MNTQKIMNWILYGNTQGIPKSIGKSSHEYDDFLKEVFKKKDITTNEKII